MSCFVRFGCPSLLLFSEKEIDGEQIWKRGEIGTGQTETNVWVIFSERKKNYLSIRKSFLPVYVSPWLLTLKITVTWFVFLIEASYRAVTRYLWKTPLHAIGVSDWGTATYQRISIGYAFLTTVSTPATKCERLKQKLHAIYTIQFKCKVQTQIKITFSKAIFKFSWLCSSLRFEF